MDGMEMNITLREYQKLASRTMREGKASRFLPKQLHKALKIMRDALSLIDYDIVDIRMRDRTDGHEYLWSEWK